MWSRPVPRRSAIVVVGRQVVVGRGVHRDHGSLQRLEIRQVRVHLVGAELHLGVPQHSALAFGRRDEGQQVTQRSAGLQDAF